MMGITVSGALIGRTNCVISNSVSHGLTLSAGGASFSPQAISFQFNYNGGYGINVINYAVSATGTNGFDNLSYTSNTSGDWRRIEEQGDTKPVIAFNQTSTGDILELQDNGIVTFEARDGGNVAMPQDSKKFLLGAGDDASVYYDGTNMVINPKEVGSGYLDLLGGFKVDSITNDTGLAHGTYTPTRFGEANLDANAIMTVAQYLRVGNTVTVSGRFTADPTLTATLTNFAITLPVTSDIGAMEDLAGVAFCGSIASMGAEIIGSVANNAAVIRWIASDVTSQTWSYTFTYQVI